MLSRTVRSALAIMAVALMVISVPVNVLAAPFSGVVDRAKVENKTNTLGEANVELYNYADISTSSSSPVIQSGGLKNTERHLALPTKPSDTPHNATIPDYLYNKNVSVAGDKPNGAVTTVLAQITNGDIFNTKNWTGVTDPVGQQIDAAGGKINPGLNIDTTGNINNSLVLTTLPAGTMPAISTRANDSAGSLDNPAGVANIASLIKDAAMVTVHPTGAQVSSVLANNGTSVKGKPTGVADNLIRNFAGAMTHVAPNGAHAITPLSVNLTSTLVAPIGVPASVSGTFYIGNVTIDANQSGQPLTVLYLCLVDTAVGGVYNQLYLSIENENYGQGALGDTTVNWGAPPAGNNNDEMVVATTDLILGNPFAPTWTVAFVANPGVTDVDVTLTSKEWYTGNFMMDVDGNLAVNDVVYFSAYDEDSNGDFEAADLSVGDNIFGQGTLDDSNAVIGNDETLNGSKMAGVFGPDSQGYTWTNTSTYNWIEINSTGTTMDLGDENAQTIDMPFDFTYYGTTFSNMTICSNGWIAFNSSDVTMDWCWEPGSVPSEGDGYTGAICFICTDLDQSQGGQNYYDTVGTAPNRQFVVEFENVVDWSTGSDGKTIEVIFKEGSNIIKMQFKDLPNQPTVVGIEALNETAGIGNNGAGDLYINPDNVTEESAYEFYPPGSQVKTHVALGNYDFLILRSANPSIAPFAVNVTSSEWFRNTIPFDANESGKPVHSLNYALGDTNSDGIYDRIDLSFNGTFGAGTLNNNVVNLTDGERYNWPSMPATITIGTTLPFTLDFDQNPIADNSDVRITASRYFWGTFTVDSDDSGVADDVYYYALVDSNSDGAYDSIDVSTDNVYGQGNLADKIVVANNDERYQWGKDIRLGTDLYFNISTAGSPSKGVSDLTVTNFWTYKGNISFDTNLDGKMNENLYFIISDTDTNGIYDTMDLSFDPIFGEGLLTDGLITAKPYNDERITADSDVQLGQGMNFFVSFDKNPQADNSDVRIKIKVWFEGTFMVDAAATGTAGNKLYYVLSDTNSDGFMDSMDLSLGDNTYGEGNLGDGTVASGNDERITKETSITVGQLHYDVNFTGSPFGLAKDGWLKNVDIYSGNFKIDMGINGTAQDVVNYVLSDSDADGLYDTIDLSLGDAIFRQDLSSDTYVDVANNDETLKASGDVRIGPFVYDLTFVWDPFSSTKAVKLTSKQWYLSSFLMDVDGDGLANETIYFLISDMDSNGVYDQMDLSIGDKDFGQGAAPQDLTLSSGNDELITQTTTLSVGVQKMEARFTPSPNQNVEDAFMKNTQWFSGTFEGSGWVLFYNVCDKNSNGVFDTMELSTNPTYGEGDNADGYVQASNDEILQNGKTVTYASMHYMVLINGTMGGAQDVGLRSLEWRTGRWTVEGLSRTVAVSDGNSDGKLDAVHIDLNDDGSYDGPSDITGGMDGIKGTLIMRYIVASSNEDGTQIEIVPENASIGQTGKWMVGYVVIDGINVGIAVCDHNGDGVFDKVDMDLSGDGVMDVKGLTVTEIASAQVNAKNYRAAEIARDGNWVRFLSYTDALIGSAIDRSVSGTLYYGKVSEDSVGLDLNSDQDMTDYLSAVVVDFSTTGSVSDRIGLYLDTNLNGDLTDEEPLMTGAVFDMGYTSWKVDNIASDRKEVGLMRTNGAIATATTGPNGAFSLNPADGTYWVRISSAQVGWGYKLVEDTNTHKGYKVSGTGITDKELVLTQTGTAMSGHVTDMMTGEPLDKVAVTVYNSEGKKVVSTQTLDDGTYLVGVQRNMVYDVAFSLTGYATDDGTLSNGTWHGVAVGAGRDDISVALMPVPSPDIMSFTEPAEGTVVSGTVTVKVTVTADVKVDMVLISVNDGITWNDMSGSGTDYSYSWNTNLGPDGTYKLAARATNEDGLRVDKRLTLKVDNGGPIVSFKTAKQQYGSVELAIKASDEFSDVKKVEVRIDGGAWKTMSKGNGGYYYIWSSGPFDSGTHKYEVRATDSRGNVETYKSTVQVDNTWMLLLIVMVVMLVVLVIVIVKKKKKKAAPVNGLPPQGVSQ